MDELTHLHEHRVFLRREALAHGYDDRSLNEALRAGVLHRIRHGAYTSTEVWTLADRLERYRLRCHAVLESHEPGVALTHTSAAVMHGIDVWDCDLDSVHLTRVDRRSTRRSAGVTYHRGQLPDDQITALGPDHLIVAPARAAIEHATLVPIESGLITLDSFLHTQCQPDTSALWAVYDQMQQWPGMRHMRITVGLARIGAQSAGESRSRFGFFRFGIPEPVLQFVVRDSFGRLIGITDFAWPEHHLLGEFDGRGKYGRLLQPGETPGDAVFREKRREDQLRDVTGWAMVRLTWGDFYNWAETAARVRRHLQHAA